MGVNTLYIFTNNDNFIHTINKFIYKNFIQCKNLYYII